MSDSNTNLDQALLEWSKRLAARERTLDALQANLIAWSGVLAQMAMVLGEITALQRGEPVAARSEAGARPVLKLVQAHPEEKETQ